MVATFPGAGSPPALRGPSGGGRNGSISTTFRWYDATRHRQSQRRIRRRLWTRPCGKVAVRQGVPHHIDGDQDHKFGWPQPREHPHVRPLPSPDPLRHRPTASSTGTVPPTLPHRTHKTEADHAIGLHYSANGTGSNRGPICLGQVVWQRKTLFFCRLRAGAGRVRAVGLGLVTVRHLRAGVGWDANLSPGLGRGGLARLTAVPGAGDDGSLSGAAVLPRTVGGNLSRLLVGNEQVVLYHVLRLAPAQGEGL